MGRAVRTDEWLFLLLVASLPIMQPLNAHYASYTLPATDFLFVGVSIAFAVAVLRGLRPLQFRAWYWTLFAYGVALVLSTVFSEDWHRSSVKLGGSFYLMGLAVLTVNYVTSVSSLRRALMAWFIGTAVTIASAVLDVVLFFARVDHERNMFLFSYGSLPPGPYPRVMALFLNANMLCTYTVASVVLLLAARGAAWIPPRLGRGLLAGTLFTTALSLSPGIGGLLLGLGIWYSRVWRGERLRARSALIMGCGGAVGFLLAVTVSLSAVMRAATPRDLLHQLAPSSRILTWADAWRTFLAHPWFGKGLGLGVAEVHYVNASGLLEVLTDAHNTWLSVLAQAGFFGAVTFASVVASLLFRFRPMTTEGAPERVMRTGLELAFICAFLYQSLSGSFENTRHVWVLMGLVLSAQRLTSRATISADPGFAIVGGAVGTPALELSRR